MRSPDDLPASGLGLPLPPALSGCESGGPSGQGGSGAAQALGPAAWVPGRGGSPDNPAGQEMGQLRRQALGPHVLAARNVLAGVTPSLPRTPRSSAWLASALPEWFH